MSDHVLAGDILHMRRVDRRFTRKPLLEQCRDPGRAIAERFNLLVLNKDGIAPIQLLLRTVRSTSSELQPG